MMSSSDTVKEEAVVVECRRSELTYGKSIVSTRTLANHRRDLITQLCHI